MILDRKSCDTKLFCQMIMYLSVLNFNNVYIRRQDLKKSGNNYFSDIFNFSCTVT